MLICIVWQRYPDVHNIESKHDSRVKSTWKHDKIKSGDEIIKHRNRVVLKEKEEEENVKDNVRKE